MNAHLSAFDFSFRRATAASLLGLSALIAVIVTGPANADEPSKGSQKIGIERVETYPHGAEKIVIEPDYPHEYPVEVEIWTRKGNGAKYCVGEPIEIYFRTNRDSYVAIYNTDTTGRTHRLFPNRWDHDNFVEGGRTYRLPARGYDFRIEGPRGHETLHAVAALDRRDLKLPRYHPTSRSYSRYDSRYDRHDRRDRYGKGYYGTEKISVVPSEPAFDTISHRVRDGYRCERRYPRTRPWWK